MNYEKAVIKQNLETILMFPIIFIGKLAGYFIKLSKPHNYFLFFAAADIGGSIKVNADITEIIKHKKPLIIFSKKPKNNKFKELFESEEIECLDLSKWIDNKALHFINIFFRGVISTWINRSEKPIVFGGECIFFYKVIPHIKKEANVIELCHMNTWLNYSQAFLKRIDARIFSTQKVMRDVQKQYLENNISEEYFRRLHFIDNKIDIPPFSKTQNDVFQILFVGRGAPQKRVHLLVNIAKRSLEKKLTVHFNFVGDVFSFFKELNLSNCTLYGEIKSRKELEEKYEENNALILTSAYEGLPLVVMDMMARGKIIISTAVDGIPDYIEHLENGLLIENLTESQIVEDALSLISMISSDKLLQEKISANAYQFAYSHFSKNVFDSFYREILKIN